MATVRLVVTDNPDGSIQLTLDASDEFPARSTDWTTAQHAAMYAYHILGRPAQDLETTEHEGEG